MSCIGAWSRRYEKLLVRLSGGLDSSILTLALGHTKSTDEVVCITRFSRTPSGDERKYAKMVSERTGFGLIEVEDPESLSLEEIVKLPVSEIPALEFGYLEVTRTEATLARDLGTEAVFWGDMGDVLFHYAPALPAAAEYLSRYGLRPHLFEVAMNVAQLEGVSIWRVLADAFSERRRNSKGYCWSPLSLIRRSALFTNEAVEGFSAEVSRFGNIWLRDVASTHKLPFGKLWQIFLLPYDSSWRDPLHRPGDPQLVAPFMSQPLVEVCLRVPTHFNISGGWDRAVARQAFATDLPGEIGRRMEKGTPVNYFRRLIETNVKFIRELLLDGILVKEGLLSASNLERCLPGAPNRDYTPNGMIFVALGVEAWLRKSVKLASRIAA